MGRRSGRLTCRSSSFLTSPRLFPSSQSALAAASSDQYSDHYVPTMSRFWPRSRYAEDQPFAYTILSTHVVTRAVTAGSLVSLAITTTRQLLPALHRPSSVPFPTRLLLSSARGSLIAVGITSLGLAGRMHGREYVEWQDRSWRLLENQGQVETDDWTYSGMAAGALSAMVLKSGLGWRGLLGAAGLGSVGGTVGYLGWRYGVNGGKFPERNLD